eukprot:CAMPEP_0203766582 /NCGR_PEP_ID=MMETSP0099_2-20121227/502_1 /ASSEMBLY_ACC=CAM_ASM_000209 /TAXON_ID=96639 /ORGANISM=" , Strain NY0313808BC1" /LENGTH=199 /DNA_ID=CAMNT_0050662957 /DNA_START=39 /DNA_END=638 /DNA_ORIENTATION=-
MSSSVLPYCQRGRDLVQELGRGDWIPMYNDEAVRQITEEVNALYKEILDISQEHKEDVEMDDPRVKCPLVLYHTSACRNKRYLLAYLKFRMQRLINLRWEIGSVIPTDMKRKVSAEEGRFFDSYDDILQRYMRRTVDVDLTSDMQPPKNLFIEVRVLEDCGEVLTDSGSINLAKNTTHYLRRSDVEHLIRQGMLKQISC